MNRAAPRDPRGDRLHRHDAVDFESSRPDQKAKVAMNRSDSSVVL